MLVVTRKPDEGLNINAGEIMVTVLAIEGDRVKLGITAPRHVTILRQELCEIVRQENLAAAIATGGVEASNQLAAIVRGLIASK